MAGILDQLFGTATAQLEPVLRELTDWVGQLQGHALKKWAPVVMSGVRCSVRRDRQPCGRVGIAKCVLCGQVVCLRHAAVGHDATVICEPCLDDYADVVKQKAGDRPQPAAPEDPATAKKNALKTLGLNDIATFADVKAAYKAAVLKHHPDRHQKATAAVRKKHEALFREADAAYRLLSKIMEKP